MFPIGTALKFPVLIYGKCRIVTLKGRIELEGGIQTGMLAVGRSDPLRSAGNVTCLSLMGTLRVCGPCVIRRGTSLLVWRDALLEFQPHCFVSDNCSIFCFKHIRFGNNVTVGNNCVVMDTDFHYTLDTVRREVKDNRAEILIGDNNWIGGWCTVKKGTQTPVGTILAGPHTTALKNYTSTVKPYSVLAGSPAEVVAEGIRMVHRSASESLLLHHFANHSECYTLPESADADDFCLDR
jgi:acetyltransferase-like isoleucine patch superfamily enzyme